MAPIVTSSEIGRPAEEVFACATHPARFKQRQKGVVDGHMDALDGGAGIPDVGARWDLGCAPRPRLERGTYCLGVAFE